MSHPTAVQLSMHADQALPVAEATEVSQHLATCTLCQGVLQAVQAENRLIAAALKTELHEDVPALVVLKFSRPASLREFALANVATALVIWLAGFLWKTLFGELVMNAATWITSVFAPDMYELLSATALYLLQEGTAMLDAYLGLIVLSFGCLTVAWLLLKYRNHRIAPSLCLLLLLGTTLVVPAPVSALEIRRDEDTVTLAASEILDDTLIAAAETVLIRGDVTGDLVAVGRRIEVDGSVAGNLVAFAETVIVRGEVGGLVLGAASKFELAGASVGGNLLAAGERVSIDPQTQIVKNAMLAGELAIVEGSVGKDLYTFAETMELSGELGEDLEAFGERVRLLDNARVGGSARLRIEDEDRLQRSPSAKIVGELTFAPMPEGVRKGNRYSRGEFYLWQIARILSAVLVGLVLIWLVPGLRNTAVGGGVDGLKTAGIGLVTLVSVPIVALLVGITLVGIPLSFIGFVLWLIAIYLAKIVVGAFVGRTLLGNTKYSDNLPLILLAGMTVIILVVNLPLVGGVISFILTIVGMGLIVQRGFASLSARRMATATDGF